jgi:hypothetical protein
LNLPAKAGAPYIKATHGKMGMVNAGENWLKKGNKGY